MTPAQYAAARRARGTQAAVARALGIHPVSLYSREIGKARITEEMRLALLALPLRPDPPSRAGRPRSSK